MTTPARVLAAPEVRVAAGQVPREPLARRAQPVRRAQQAMRERVEREVRGLADRPVQQARQAQQARPVRQAPRAAPMVARPTLDLMRQTHPEQHHVSCIT